MSKKFLVSGVLATSVALAATLGGCSLVSSNATADMNQVIAQVNVANSESFDKNLTDYKDALGTSEIIKRELVAYFLNVGYSQVQNGNYEEVFTRLMDSLVNNEILVQYATMYLLKDKAENSAPAKTAAEIIAEYNSKESQAEKYEWLLGGKDSKDVMLAEYALLSSINSAIDNYERQIIDEENSSSGTATRATPSGVDTEKEDYYPKKEDGSLDYNVYTGYGKYKLTDSGVYQDNPVEGSTKSTRIRAYNRFISSLASSSYGLVDSVNEDLRDVRNLNYVGNEYVTQLEQRVVEKYYDLYESVQEELLKSDGYSYIQAKYESLLDSQTGSYRTESDFSSALGSMSDNTFILYAPESEDGNYGFVYNILLPFSATQSATLSSLQTVYADSTLDGGYKPEYFVARNELLSQIETYDQREAWFNGSTEYAFKPNESVEYFGKNSGREYLFFENNLQYSDRYESLPKYDGRYAYNGTAIKGEDDYILIPEKLDIDDMLAEFEAYVEYASGATVTVNPTANYGSAISQNHDSLYKTVNGKKQIDYGNFVYATGSVAFTQTGEDYNRNNVLYKNNEDSQQYKALAAVNELQYAYTTDTAVLSQYLGYSIDAGETSYIKEFEYAAHEAIKNGAGSFAVCAGNYGWHLIYVTYTFDNSGTGAQYAPQWAQNIDKEGTFENLFYEMVKSSDMSDISTSRSTQIIRLFKSDATVTTYQSRYQDLLDISDNN